MVFIGDILKGICHICGREQELTFEHVPPRSAYNSEAVRVLGYVDWVAARSGMPAGTVQKQGSGSYTLCGDCNNRVVGSRYGTDYVNWVVHIQKTLSSFNFQIGDVIPLECCNVRPLRLLKQICAFMLCFNSPRWGQTNRELREFVLRRDERSLPNRFKLYMFITWGPFGRSIGCAGVLNVRTGRNLVVTETIKAKFEDKRQRF